MKNIVIVLLVLITGVFGYMLLTRDTVTSPGTIPNNENETTDQDTTITPSDETLDLSGRGLSEIDKDILDNNKITTLNVSNNNLTGALPAEIRKLTNLEVLIASDNSLTGIPAEIGQLSKLKQAVFSNNDISGLPLEIGNLKNLETLDLRGNPNVSTYDIGLLRPEIPNADILY